MPRIKFNTISCCAKWSVLPGDILDVTEQEAAALIAGNYAVSVNESGQLFTPFFGEGESITETPKEITEPSKAVAVETATLNKTAETAARSQTRKSESRGISGSQNIEKDLIAQRNAGKL